MLEPALKGTIGILYLVGADPGDGGDLFCAGRAGEMALGQTGVLDVDHSEKPCALSRRHRC